MAFPSDIIPVPSGIAAFSSDLMAVPCGVAAVPSGTMISSSGTAAFPSGNMIFPRVKEAAIPGKRAVKGASPKGQLA